MSLADQSLRSLKRKFWEPRDLVFVFEHKRTNPSPVLKRLWFTSGCFDLFHPGHLQFLQQAGYEASKDHAVLVVAVNSDISIYSYKRKTPILDLQSRMLLVANCEYVDYVLSFDEPHPVDLVNLIQPDVIVHGTGQGREPFKCSKELEGYSGKVKLIEHKDNSWSTSNLIQKIKDAS